MSLHNNTGWLKKWHIIALLVLFNICLIAAAYLYHISVYYKQNGAAVLFVIITFILILLIDLCFILMYKYHQSNLYKEMYLKEKDLNETKERNSKHILSESETRFSSIFHYSPIGITITCPDGKLIDVNDIFLETSGYSRDELIGKTTLEIGFYRNPLDSGKICWRTIKRRLCT